MRRADLPRARLRYAWGTRSIEIGPLLITTHQRATANQWNAFELGRDHGSAFGPTPREKPERRLHVVS